jgi:hypothetical protein
LFKIFAAGLSLALVSSSFAIADDASPKDILSLMLVTGAVVDFCKLDVDPAMGPKMAAEVTKYQKQLGISDDDLTTLNKQTVDSVTSSKPDCTENGDLVKAARQMIELVKADQS